LLALARAEEAGASPPLETVDLKEVSAVVVNRLINQAIQAQVELNLEASDAESYRVEAHRTLVFEILANLVDNGIRYNRPGGTVTIALAQGEDATLMTVSDDGPGIAVEHRDKVFERFFRVGGASAPEGTGLGLAIVQSAASRMGAQVEIVEGGAGTHIRVRFPRRGEDGAV
jgi:two-component system sensor histidine kinase TctE